MSGASLEFDGVTVRYGETIGVADVDLRIDPGAQVALVGPSGSGKTTLLRLAGAIREPTKGRVRVDGTDLSQLSPKELRRFRSTVATIYQDLRLVPELRVYQNVAAVRAGRRSFLGLLRDLFLPSGGSVAQIHEILESVGIEEKLYHRTNQLSGGQQQRVAIARSLYQEPAVLLADEPVSSVDPARARDVVRLLCDAAREREITLVMSLHNLELARDHFSRLVGLRNGRVMFDDDPSNLSSEAFTRLYSLTEEEMIEQGAHR